MRRRIYAVSCDMDQVRQTGKLDRWQKKLVNLAIDDYEKTSTYRKENAVNQTIRIRADRIYPAYYDDAADYLEVETFEKSMQAFEKRTPFRIAYRNKKLRGEFSTIDIRADCVEPLLYQMAGRTPKRTLHAAEIPLYEKFLAYGEEHHLDPIIGFCRDQIERLQEDKNSRYGDAAEMVLTLTLLICENREDVLVRELSIRAFGDSKTVEKRALLNRALYILTTWGQYDFAEDDFDDSREYEDAVLAEYHVFRNPTYVNFNGNATIRFANGTVLQLKAGVPVALRSDRIGEICSVHISDSKFMTVENLTSYNRLVSADMQDTFMVYLAGYHNKVKQDFLVRVHEDNPGIQQWLHFGDIDPDGFLILENLRQKTGIDFLPWRMGTAELQQYAGFCKRLNANDRKKAENLLNKGKYADVLRWMMDHDAKLEQEIISWQETQHTL